MPWTTTNLYRRGNTGGPRMAHVRVGKDVSIFQRDGIDWVQAQTGGISTFSSSGPGNLWWELPAGSEYPDDILVVNDHGHHFSWEPRIDMPLTDFVELLESIEPAFHQVT